MAHKLVSGIDRMVATRLDTVWHRAETLTDGRLRIVQPTDPESTFLQAVAIVLPKDADNDVYTSTPLRTVDADGNWTIDVPSHVAARSRLGRVLGVVTSTHEQVPMHVVIQEWLLALVRAGGMLETLGTFDGGRNYFASIQVADEWTIPGTPSATRPLCNVTGNHVGKGGIRASFASFCVVCANTDAMFASDHDSVGDASERAQRAWVTVQHSKNAIERMRDAVAWITDGRKRAESERAFLQRLADKTIHASDVKRFVDSYIAIPTDASAQTIAIRTGDRQTFGRVLRDRELQGDHAWTGSSMTAYGLLQAVTRYEDWESRTRGEADVPQATRRAFRAFLGTRAGDKSIARDMIREITGVR